MVFGAILVMRRPSHAGSGLQGLRSVTGPATLVDPTEEVCMHYPHKISRIKKVRATGFRKRMSTRKGRKIINSKRRLGRAIRVR
jgi:ribosomal protein L34